MKDYDETINTVFERIDEYKLKQARKRKILIRTVLPISSLCIAALIGIAVWQGDFFKSQPPAIPEDSNIVSEKDNLHVDGQEAPPSNSGNNTSTTEDTVGSPNGVVGDNDTADVLGAVIVDEIQYVQYSIDDTLFTADKYLGDAREFDGTYKSHINDITAELYTVKESDNVMIVKLGNGGTVVLGRAGDIIVNGKLYGITGINPTEHVVGEFLGTANKFEIIDVPYREKRINSNDEIWSMKDYNDGLFIKTTDGKWVVLYYYPLYGYMS